MKRTFWAPAAALVAVFGLLSCASGPSKEQQLVAKAVEATGGAQAIADVRTVSLKGTAKQWEPEQSDVPGGEMRFANEIDLRVHHRRPGARLARRLREELRLPRAAHLYLQRDRHARPPAT